MLYSVLTTAAMETVLLFIHLLSQTIQIHVQMISAMKYNSFFTRTLLPELRSEERRVGKESRFAMVVETQIKMLLILTMGMPAPMMVVLSPVSCSILHMLSLCALISVVYSFHLTAAMETVLLFTHLLSRTIQIHVQMISAMKYNSFFTRTLLPEL